MSEWLKDHPEFILGAFVAVVGFFHWLQRIGSRSQHLETRDVILKEIEAKYALETAVAIRFAAMQRWQDDHINRCHGTGRKQ